MRLFLADVTLRHHEYPDRSWTEEQTHIVAAADEDDARTKVRAALRREDPYGHDVEILLPYDVDLKPMIGELIT